MGPVKTTRREWKMVRKCGNWVCIPQTYQLYIMVAVFIYYFYMYIIYHIYAFLKTTRESKMGRVKTILAVWELGVHTTNIPAPTLNYSTTTFPLCNAKPDMHSTLQSQSRYSFKQKLGCLVYAKSAQLFMSNGLDIVHLHGWEIQSNFVW